MGNILTIAGREIKSYFASPLAYILTGLFALFIGFLFSFVLIGSKQADMENTFSWMWVLGIILMPALTMRLFAEENRMGTIELLMTAPVRDWQIVIGKYIAGLLAFLALVLPTLWYIVILWRFGPPDYGKVAAGYIGFVLGGAAFVAIGMFTSSVTGNQVIAFFFGFLILIFLWVAGLPANVIPAGNPLVSFLSYVSLSSNFSDFFSGVIDLGRVLFFLSLVAIPLFLTVRVVESRRWR